jgi:parvulin-like peptidyl-prolyl isomerase
MPAAFDQVAFSLNKGDFSEVVETEFGFHVMQMLDKKPAGPSPYEEVREFIRGYLQSIARPRLMNQHVQELRQQAAIETYLVSTK